MDVMNVSDEVVEAAARALHGAVVYPQGADHSEHWGIFAGTYRGHARVVLAAVVPLLREQIASEVEADPGPTTRVFGTSWIDSRDHAHAARIVRGES